MLLQMIEVEDDSSSQQPCVSSSQLDQSLPKQNISLTAINKRKSGKLQSVCFLNEVKVLTVTDSDIKIQLLVSHS